MASRREYEMLFQLNAKLNSGFSGTFGKVQQQLLSIQKEIQELNRLQADISAYQKQQQAIESIGGKLETLNARYDITQREMQETETYLTSLKKKFEDAEPDTEAYNTLQQEIRETEKYYASLEDKTIVQKQQIDRTNESLEKHTEKFNELGQTLQEAGVDTEHLQEESERLNASLADLKETQEEVAESAENLGENSVNAFEAIGDAIAAAGIVAALHEIYQGYMECIAITGEFEDSMANVSALSGATAPEMEQLGDLAKELGATTKFTAKESADAMGYMAMAGWDAQQMISGMPGVLKLAAASGEDLALVSDIVTDSMTAFGLTAVDSSHYADVLAAAATSANTNVAMMGETFKYAAPMAGALGYDVEDVAVAVGMMANAGIKGSQAGTSLNNIFTRLAKPTKESADAMDALGISLLDGSGNMYTFMELMEIMRNRFAGLTETQKAFYAAELAGQRGMSGLLSIVNASESDFASLSESITGCAGAAERMAAIKLDTMNGQLTLANSAAEALKTTVGEQFTPMLKSLYSESANVMTEVNAFLKANPGVIKAIAAITAGLGMAAAGITTFTAAAKVMALVTSTLNPAALGFIAVASAVTALGAGMLFVRDQFNDTTYTAREQQKELERLQAEYEDVCATYGETSSEANALRYQINALSAEYDASGHSIQGLIRDHESLAKSAGETAKAHQESLARIHDEALDALALGGELQRLAASYTGAAGEAQMMGRIIEELNSRYEGLDLTLENVTSGTYDWGESLDAYIKQTADAQEKTEKLNRAITLVTEEREWQGKVKEYTKEIEAAEKEVQRLKELQESAAIGYNGSTAYDVDYSNALANLGKYRALLEEANEELKKNQTEYAEIQEALGGIAESLSGTEEAGQRLQNVINVTAASLDGLVEKYNEAYAHASASVQGQYEMWDEAAKVIPTSVAKMTEAMQGQIDYWQKYRENLEYLRDQAVNIEGLDEILENLADGSEESVNAVAGIANALKDGSGDVGAMVGAYKDLKTEQDKVSQSMADTATHFSQKLAEMQNNLEQAVRDMDVSGLAEESARSTIQGFINQADGMLSSVQAAYSRLGQTAAKALESSFNNITANLKMPSLPAGVGYATGTRHAEPGFHPVGERGAEIVYFRGGENALTPNEVRKLREELTLTQRTMPEYRHIGLTDNAAPSDTASGAAQTFERVTREIRDGMSGAEDGVLVGANGPEMIYFTGGEVVLTANETRELQRETLALNKAFEEQLISIETAREFGEFAHKAQGRSVTEPNGAESLSFAFPIAEASPYGETRERTSKDKEYSETSREISRESRLIRERLSERAATSATDTERDKEIRELIKEHDAIRAWEQGSGNIQQASLGLMNSTYAGISSQREISAQSLPAVFPLPLQAEAHFLQRFFRKDFTESDGRRIDFNSYAPNGNAVAASAKTSDIRHRGEALRNPLNNYHLPVSNIPAYASGTDSAVPGAALLGAHGPELVVFQGGEKVLTANETRELQRESSLLNEMLSEESFLFGASETQDSFKDFQSEILMAETYQNSLAPFPIPAYASGTDSAVPGVAYVGERGPELALWGNAEKELNSREIRELRESFALRHYATEEIARMRETLGERSHNTVKESSAEADTERDFSQLYTMKAYRKTSEAMRSEAMRELREIQRTASYRNHTQESERMFPTLVTPSLTRPYSLPTEAISNAVYPADMTAALSFSLGAPMEASLPGAITPISENPLEAEWDVMSDTRPAAGNGGGVYTITVSPSYTNYFSGNTQQEDVEKAMFANTDRLRETIERIMEDIEADNVRSDFR